MAIYPFCDRASTASRQVIRIILFYLWNNNRVDQLKGDLNLRVFYGEVKFSYKIMAVIDGIPD